jgi:hypothetical protein
MEFFSEGIVSMLKKLKSPMDLTLIFFCEKSLTRRSLDQIGRAAVASKKIKKIEIKCPKYYFLIGGNDTTYIVLNIGMDSESETDSSSESESASDSCDE